MLRSYGTVHYKVSSRLWYSALAEVTVPCIIQYQLESRSHGTLHYIASGTTAEVTVPCIIQYKLESRSHGTLHYIASGTTAGSYGTVHYTISRDDVQYTVTVECIIPVQHTSSSYYFLPSAHPILTLPVIKIRFLQPYMETCALQKITHF